MDLLVPLLQVLPPGCADPASLREPVLQLLIMKIIGLFLLLAGLSSTLSAQDIPDIERLLETNEIENSEEGYREMVDILVYLQSSPLNINTADFDSLKILFLLSDAQIDRILAFRKKVGNFMHLNELLWVPGMGRKDLENISSFVTLGQVGGREQPAAAGRRNRQEVLAKMRTTLPRQEGYKIYPPGDFDKRKDYYRKAANRFQAPPLATLLKYKVSAGNHFRAGVTLENDAGEAYFTRNQKTGFDFFSAYAAITSWHCCRQLLIGDYRLQWGQGLIAWGGFASGKSAVAVGNEKSGKGIAPYSSTDENNYLRGIAVSLIPVKNLILDIFFSKKLTDANLTPVDTLADEDLTAVSLYISGYHRNDNECAKKHTLQEVTTGISAHWNTPAFKVGVNALYYDFTPMLIPPGRLYQQYNDTGKKRYLYSIDYKTSYRGIYLFGETAVSDHGAVATENGLRWTTSFIAACLIYRRYDKRYTSRYAAGFGEYSNTSNEEGLYLGFDLAPAKNFRINAYWDWFHFFSPRYGATIPGAGWEVLVEATYRHSCFEHCLRYKQVTRPEDIKGGKSVQRTKREYRYQMNYRGNERFRTQTRFSVSRYHKDSRKEKGAMVSQDIIYISRHARFKMQYRIAWFKTDSYQSRIYAYENNVLYGYSFPAFMGEGWRTYLNLSWKPLRLLTCYLKAGLTAYPDREKLSSGLALVRGNKLCDFTCQLRLSF